MKPRVSDEFYRGMAAGLPLSMVLWGVILLGLAWVSL